MLSAVFLIGTLLCFPQAQGVPGEQEPRNTVRFLPNIGLPQIPTGLYPNGPIKATAEMAIWESLGVTDQSFDSTDSFLQSLGLTMPPDYTTMRFILFTRGNRTGTEITTDPDNLKKLLDPSIPTKIFVHGYKNNVHSEIPVLMRNAYLDHGDYNMIHVDWADLAAPPNYIAARSHAVGVALRTSELLNGLADSGISAPKDQHIIGHSLGAHVAGLASGLATKRVGRCTGLDPAGPLFQLSTKGRLDPSQADLVDVIHTTAAFWGFPGPIGLVDFYPNGGIWPQPKCFLDFSGDCSHGMAAKMFAHTISNPDAFQATHCQTQKIVRGECPANEDRATMGEHIKFERPGMYYLKAEIP